jgi:hypothetical protein
MMFDQAHLRCPGAAARPSSGEDDERLRLACVGAPIMTAALSRRLSRLEHGRLVNAELIGVGSMSLTDVASADLQRFALAHDLPSRCAMCLSDGPDHVLLTPSPVHAIHGEGEAIWMQAAATYPHVLAVWDDGQVAAWRFESEAESVAFALSHDAQPERMLA